MNRLVLAFFVAGACASLSTSNGLAADIQPTPAAATHARITQGPQLERATDSWAIIRWTTNNIKGTSLRYAVVHYGTNPHDLGETAKSPNRWNPGLPYMIYRVQINHLKPGTTYYYRVQSQNALNVSVGPESAVDQFATQQSP